MYRDKYNAEESLERIKLMMKYDSSKTLNENRVIVEQTTCSNPIDYDTLVEYVEQAEEALDDIFNWTGTKDMLDSSEDAKDVHDALKAVQGKNVYDDEEGKCVPAIELFKKRYKDINSEDWIGGNDTLEGDIQSALDNDLGAESNRYLRICLQILKSPAPPATTDGGNKTDGGKSGGGKSGGGKSGGGSKSTYSPCTGTYKRGCKADKIKEVQACLGMPGKYQTGNFGPITQGELTKLGKGFENGFTDADISVICKKEPAKPTRAAGVEDLEDDNTASTTAPF